MSLCLRTLRLRSLTPGRQAVKQAASLISRKYLLARMIHRRPVITEPRSGIVFPLLYPRPPLVRRGGCRWWCYLPAEHIYFLSRHVLVASESTLITRGRMTAFMFVFSPSFFFSFFFLATISFVFFIFYHSLFISPFILMPVSLSLFVCVWLSWRSQTSHEFQDFWF